MYLAFCSDITAFQQDKLRDLQWSSRFPGSGWVTCLYRSSALLGITITSGDIALLNVKSNKWEAKDVCVIQDMTSVHASRLLDLGATPFLITCFEAPLYAPFFYDKISRLAANFKFSFGFGFPENSTTKQSLPFRFPSFYLGDMRKLHSWHDRKKLVLVAANKYKSNSPFIPNRPSLKNVLRQLKWLGWQLVSPAYRTALGTSLHEPRLEAIMYFAAKGECDLYGSGWDKLDELPSRLAHRLKFVTSKSYLGLCQNKLNTISDYRFSICFENMKLPGYVTEKIIDCFVAGTIPLYLGAPDIEAIVPPDSFIDMRKFSSLDQLDTYMNAMTEQHALRMFEAGREYLQTEAGMLHSYEGFSQHIIRLAQSC